VRLLFNIRFIGLVQKKSLTHLPVCLIAGLHETLLNK